MENQPPTTNHQPSTVYDKIRNVPDFPKPGIMFRDITTALKEPETLHAIIDYFCDRFKDEKIDYVAGIESRGFILGMPIAYKLNAGFVPIRKPNKLPAATFSESYELEYGTDTLEIHQDAIEAGARVLIVDDLLATGGTAEAACKLVKKTGANLVGIAFLIELCGLNGRSKLQGENIVSMLEY
jgi:adenine phosphoribosyltransferase